MAGRVTYRHPVFDLPAAPPGWEGGRGDLIRIVDPLGNAIAWFAPEYGAACAGYAVRTQVNRTAQWREMFCPAPSPERLGTSDEFGCTVVWPCSDQRARPEPSAWQFIERDPTSATFMTVPQAPGPAAAYPMVPLRLTATLESGALSLTVAPEGVPGRSLLSGFGIQAAFAPGVVLVTDPHDSRSRSKIDITVMFSSDDQGRRLTRCWHTMPTPAGPAGHAGGPHLSVTFHHRFPK